VVDKFLGEIKTMVSGWFIIKQENRLKMDQECYSNWEERDGEECAYDETIQYLLCKKYTQKELSPLLNEAFLTHNVNHNHHVMSSSINQEVTVYDSRLSGSDIHLSPA